MSHFICDSELCHILLHNSVFIHEEIIYNYFCNSFCCFDLPDKVSTDRLLNSIISLFEYNFPTSLLNDFKRFETT